MSSDVFLFPNVSFLRVVFLRNHIHVYLTDASEYRWPNFLSALSLVL